MTVQEETTTMPEATNDTSTSPARPAPCPPGQALEVLREELLAIDARDLHPVNVDVAAAALVVIGAASEIRAYRPALAALCGEEMCASIDRLELVANATLNAQAVLQAMGSSTEVQTLSAELVKLREALLAEVRALIAREVLPRGVIGELRGAHGFQNQFLDVLQLVSILKDQWEVVGPETGLSLAYIHRAEASANALATAVGIRKQAHRSPATDMRQRAYTLMATTYNEVRRMITFLRWNEDDADRIAPSLFRGRGKGRRRKEPPAQDIARPGPGAVVARHVPGAPPHLAG